MCCRVRLFLPDVNECATSNVCPSGICINNAGSFACQDCRPGFAPSADGLRCEGAKSIPSLRQTSVALTTVFPISTIYLAVSPDVNECSQGDLCLGGVCANTEGSYSCTRCKAGYRVSQDQQRCEGEFCLSLLTHRKTFILSSPRE